VTVVGADCANADPTRGATSYEVFVATPGPNKQASFVGISKGSVMGIRSAAATAPGKGGSVYATVTAIPGASGQPYEESDILMPQRVLSYEGVLG
jgi:hypothetical protein